MARESSKMCGSEEKNAFLDRATHRYSLDGIDEHVVGSEHGAGALQYGEKELQRQDLGAQFM